MTHSSHYVGKELAALYNTSRPKLPEQILKKILGFLSQKFELNECVAVDVGCGSGQSAIPVAEHVKQVYGFDVSEDQINEGNRINTRTNVSFKLGSAEELPFPDSSVHLVLASTAAHWFDMAAFLKEVDRILLPNGVLAISSGTSTWSYKSGKDDSKIPKITELADDINDAYWSGVTGIVPLYDKLKLPYASAASKEKLMIPEKFTVASMMDRMRSIGGVSQFEKSKPEKANVRLQDFRDRFMKFLGSTVSPEETEFELKWLYILCLTRKQPLDCQS